MFPEFDEEMPEIQSRVRLVEAGKIYKPGDVFDVDSVSYDRLIYILNREYVWPVGGLQELPEPLFTDLMVTRD